MVVKAAFFVLLLAGVAVALLAHLAGVAACAVAGVAVGVVLLVADDVRGVVQLQRCGAEVVVELVALHGRGVRDKVPVFHGQGFDQGNAPFVVHDVQCFSFRIQNAVHHLSPYLEAAEVQAGFHDAGFLEDVAEHEHDDKGGGIGHHEDAHDHHHDGEDDAFGLAHLTESLHANLAFLVVGHQAHDRRLDERHKGHVGVSSHGDGADEVLCKFVRSEDGGRTVGTTDDTDGGRFTESKATESHGAEHGREHAELSAATEEERTRVGDKRSEVRHGAHAQEDDGREEFQVETIRGAFIYYIPIFSDCLSSFK